MRLDTANTKTALATFSSLYLVGALTLGGAHVAATTPPNGSAGTAAEPLSLTTVEVSGGFNSDLGKFWIANEAGYFGEHGIESAEIYSGQAGADEVLLLLSGETNFVNSGTASNLLARQNGAPLVSVMTVNRGGTTELVLSDDAVAEIGLDVDADPLDQFLALAGSGLTIGVPSEGGTNAVILRYLIGENGMELGADVTMEALGGTDNMVAGFLSGDIDGFISPVPASIQPDSVRIPLNEIEPVSESTSISLVTTEEMINDHADVVQAVVTGYLQAADLTRNDPEAAFELAIGWLERSGVEDPESQRLVFDANIAGWGQPATSQQMFDTLLELTNAGLEESEQITVTFEDFVDNTFINQAITDLGFDYEPGP